MSLRPPQLTDSHLRRRAFVYSRVSTPEQAKESVGSIAVQFDQVRMLESWGISRDRIDVMDELGVTASVADLRQQYRRILDGMRAGTHGLVAVVDINRLIRNLSDLAAFVEAAQRYDVLLVHGSQITDFRDPTSAFIALLLGLNAERENRVRAEFGRRARREKAARGIATTRPPRGYVSVAEGNWEKDDPQVRDVLQLLFDKFWELRTAGQVVRFFRKHGIKLPRRSPGGVLHWTDATRAAIVRILRNEAYCGTYVYAKTVGDQWRERDKKGRIRRVARPAGEWLRKEGHHEPYVSPHRWAEIQQCLSANRAQARPPAGRREALVQGLLRCTIHNVTFRTRYPYRHHGPD